MVTVCTVLPPTERPRVDAVGDGCFATLHADSFRAVLRAARTRRVDALVISVHRCHGDELPAVARFVREFPAIPAVALVSRHDGTATEALLRLGCHRRAHGGRLHRARGLAAPAGAGRASRLTGGGAHPRPASSGAVFPSTCRWSATSTCSSPRTGRPCARFTP